MDFKKYLPQKEGKKKTEHYWALVIEPGWVQAGIWKVNGELAEVVVDSPPAAWSEDADLVNVCDTALSNTISLFDENLEEPDKTVFGVSAAWVDGGEIKPEYLSEIKKVCKQLSLSPLGFVVLPEAIAHYLKSTQGGSVSAVLLGIYKDSLEVSLFKLDKLVESSLVARSISIADDATEGLTRFDEPENIPSLFVLYDGRGGELEEARQSLLKVNWEDYGRIKLLHTPKIELLEMKEKILAVSLAGASEMAGISKLAGSVNKQKSEESETEERSQTTASGSLTAQDLGFVSEKDVTENGGPRDDGKDAREDERMEYDNLSPVDESEFEGQKKSAKFKFKPNLKGKFFAFFSPFTKVIPNLRYLFFGKKIFIFGLMFLIIGAAAALLSWWYYPKARVTIYVSPQTLKENVQLFVDPSLSDSNASEKVLAGELVSSEASSEKTKTTTGTKTVGEKAAGEVTIYRVGPSLNLDSGTILKGPNDLNFALENDVTVASGSASSPGSVTAQVIAEDIGSDYNLASETSFGVSNYSTSDLEAKNSSSFSGGSSREISAVSNDDIVSLKESLEDELKDEAIAKIVQDVSEGRYLIENSLMAEVTDENYSAEVGDEADSLKLNLAIEAKALVVDKDKLYEFMDGVLGSKVPQGFVLRGEQINTDFTFKGEEGGVYEFEVEVFANLLPEINTQDIVDKIKGRYPKLAEDYLTKEIPGFVWAEIKIKPNLPGKLNTLPRVRGNIDVIISAEN